MFCGYCGTKLPDDAAFCSNCGKATASLMSAQSNTVEDKISTKETDTENKTPENTQKAETGAVIKDELPVETEAVIKGGLSAETEAAIKDEFPAETETVIEDKLPVETETVIKDELPVETGAVTEENLPVVTGVAVKNELPAKMGATIKDKFPTGLTNLKNDKKKLKIAGIIAVAAVIAIVAGNKVKENRKIGQLEDAIFSISSGYVDEDEIARLYEEYDALSDAGKRKVSNRDTLIYAYQQVEALIAQRKQAAAQVDNMIGAIDYSNIYAEASTLKDAAIAYNALDEKEKEYVTLFNQLQQAYDEAGNLNMAVTTDNFWELFAIEYAVGENTNYGEGTITTQSGYTIDWNRFGGTVTPNYDVNTYNDYATPVYIYVASRYPNLTSECSFYINLHQTYQGIGFVDSDTHEFKLQSATIQYNSSEGVGAYMIAVEDNDASGSLWNLFGMSFDWSDSVHQMNPFDASRVEISDVNGSIWY